ncbi:DNA polymerase I [Acetobacterium fimetarium]|uniref:DNA polymerase I n=1 Tax=Acetobacterium fimetarium TaxID=52691 RepID=A0ABR6WW21_9FIRM|nr:DNA polymerase I [Acetobacterium fimetarium]MBC3804750.1 DNA polymerase I [Acetobacterium fimetarium]
MKSILIDGNSLIYRTFYAIREMSNSKGVPTNAIYGFVNILVKIQEEYQPDYLGIAFDLKAPTFRHLAYDDYKGGRHKMPELLEEQFAILKQLLIKMDIPILELAGFEADDIIGTLAMIGAEKGYQTEIITGDRDAFQLVGPNVKVLYTKKGISQLEAVDEAWIQQEYGLTPKDLIELKALMGDKSDNIPGIAGIGEKTGIKLIQKYQTLDNLYAHIDDEKGKQKEKLIAGKEAAYKSRMLGTIKLDVPWDGDFKELSFHNIFNAESIEMLKELEFKNILSRIDQTDTVETIEKAVGFQWIKTDQELAELLAVLAATEEVTIYYHQEETGVYLAMEIENRYYYLNAQVVEKLKFFEKLLSLKNVTTLEITSQDLKNLIHIFHQAGITEVNEAFDTYVATYLLSPGDQRYDLKTAAYKYLSRTILDDEEMFGKGKKRVKASELDEQLLADYFVKNCETVKSLKTVLEKELDETGMMSLFKTIEMPLLEVMASMEELGFKIDRSQLEVLSGDFESKLKGLTREIYELAETDEFNINSPKQLGEVLFEKLKLPVVKKTKTGYSTNIDVLEQLIHFHPIVEKIIDYRTLSKLDSTYGRGLMTFVEPKTNKIYSTFNQTVAATGRLSSSAPNLQNIPVKTEMGREIRRVFVPSDADHILVDADYSQIELRVLAHLSGDENLIDAFKKEQDIHTRTASEIFGVPLEAVSRTQRGQAKAINFGLIYGKQAFSLGKELGISRNEAQNYIDRYFARYPKVQDYMGNVKKQAKEDGYVTSIWGRRRYIPEMNSRNGILVQAGERMALNTPIQGSAADIIKLAMIRVYNRLNVEQLEAELILQVHDELIIDTPKNEQEQVERLIKEEMEGAAQLSVPITVDVNSGASWYELK